MFAKSKVAIAISLNNKMDFTAIMIPQKTNQQMQYWSEKIRTAWHDQNGGKWLSQQIS